MTAMEQGVEIDVVSSGGSVSIPPDLAAVLIHQAQVVKPQFQDIAIVPQARVAAHRFIITGMKLHAGNIIKTGGQAGMKGFK